MQILAEKHGAPKRWQHIVFAVILLGLLSSQKSREGPWEYENLWGQDIPL